MGVEEGRRYQWKKNDKGGKFTVERIQLDGEWTIHLVGTGTYFCVDLFERLTGIVVRQNQKVTIQCIKVSEEFC